MSAARRRRQVSGAQREAPASSAQGVTPEILPKHPSGPPLSLTKSLFGGRAFWISAALIAVTLAVYAPVRQYDFVSFDDFQYVKENAQVTRGLSWEGARWAFTTGELSNWHPLTWLSHMLDVQLYGVNPGAHHATNVFFHILNALLLFGLVHQMTGAMGRSAFVAALFAVHPLHVESVAWIAERKDVLSTLFGLLTIWAYVEYARRPALRRYLIMFPPFALGLMAKPMLVTLPFVLLLLDIWPLGRMALAAGIPGPGRAVTPSNPRTSWPLLVKEKIPLFGLTVVSSLATYVAQKQGGAVSGLDALSLTLRLENSAVSYLAYIGKMLWPANLAVFYSYPKSLPVEWVGGSLLVLAGVSVLVIRFAARLPYLLVGWLWYLGTLVPVIGFVQVGIQSMADRYTYLPLIGLFIIMAWGIADLLSRWRVRDMALTLAAVLVILACAITARVQVGYWGSSLLLWNHAVEASADNYRAHLALGALYADQGRLDLAIQHFSEALRIRLDIPEGHNGLGAALADQGKLLEAIPHYVEALRLKPALFEAHNNLGNALWRQGKVEEAITEYREALRLKQDYAEAHNGLGAALDDQGKIEEAIAQYREALRLKPELAGAHNNLGAAYSNQEKIDEAIREFSEALRIKPGQDDTLYNLAVMLDRKGDTAEAIRHLETALKINPRSQQAQRALDMLRSKTKSTGSPGR